MAEPSSEGGLEYLFKAGKLKRMDEEAGPPDTSQRTPQGEGMSQNLEAFAARVVLESIYRAELATGGDHPGEWLSKVAEEVGMGGDVLIPLARRLESAGLVRVLESDAFGNQRLTLTDDEVPLLQPDMGPELVQRIVPS